MRAMKKRLGDLVKNKSWITLHVGECVEKNISRTTFLEKIFPVIVHASKEHSNQVDFELNLAKLGESHLSSESEIAATINCIGDKIVQEAQKAGLRLPGSIYVPLSCALFGRFFSIVSERVGYISVQ